MGIPGFRYILLLALLSLTGNCFSFNPRGSQSSLIIVSAVLEKDEPFINEFIQPSFEKVTIFKGEKELTYSERSGHYYYFQNLSPGQYELGELIHLIHKGNAGHPTTNIGTPSVIKPPLTKEDRLKTIVNLEPGAIVFMGEVQVRATIRVNAPMEINGSFSKNISAEKRAMNHLMRSFPRSGWSALAKDRLKSLNVISVGDAVLE